MLSPSIVRELTALYEDGWSQPRLAARYEVSATSVSRVVTGRSWVSVTGGRNISRAGRDTEFRRSYIEARLEQGCRNLRIIADELGVSRQAVSRLVRTRRVGGRPC